MSPTWRIPEKGRKVSFVRTVLLDMTAVSCDRKEIHETGSLKKTECHMSELHKVEGVAVL